MLCCIILRSIWLYCNIIILCCNIILVQRGPLLKFHKSVSKTRINATESSSHNFKQQVWIPLHCYVELFFTLLGKVKKQLRPGLNPQVALGSEILTNSIVSTVLCLFSELHHNFAGVYSIEASNGRRFNVSMVRTVHMWANHFVTERHKS